MCETKNNVWKKHELSILNGIDNCIKITKSKLDSASLNNGHLSHKSLFYWDCGSFILLRDVNVMLRMMCHYFSCSKWALFSWCAASCKSAIENSCKLKVQSNMVANRVIKCELHWNWCLNMIEFVTWNPRRGWQPPEPMNRFTGIHRKGGGADDGLWDHFDFHWDIGFADVIRQLDISVACLSR